MKSEKNLRKIEGDVVIIDRD